MCYLTSNFPPPLSFLSSSVVIFLSIQAKLHLTFSLFNISCSPPSYFSQSCPLLLFRVSLIFFVSSIYPNLPLFLSLICFLFSLFFYIFLFSLLSLSFRCFSSFFLSLSFLFPLLISFLLNKRISLFTTVILFPFPNLPTSYLVTLFLLPLPIRLILLFP